MSYEPPTLEGRVLVDLGQQLTAMRARAEQAEADHARLRVVLEAVVRAESADRAMAAIAIGTLPADCTWMRCYRELRKCLATT